MLNRKNASTDSNKCNDMLYRLYSEKKKSEGQIVIDIKNQSSAFQIFNNLEMARDVIDSKLIETHRSVRSVMRAVGTCSSLFSLGFFILIATENETTGRNISLGFLAILFIFFLKIYRDAHQPDSFFYRKCLNYSYNKKTIYENGIPRQTNAEFASHLTESERLIIQKTVRDYNHLSEKHGLDYKINLNTTRENYSLFYNQLTAASYQKNLLIDLKKRGELLLEVVNQFYLFGPKAPGPIIDIILDFLSCPSKEHLFKKHGYKS